MNAAVYGELDCTKYLLTKGANLNAQDKVRRAALL